MSSISASTQPGTSVSETSPSMPPHQVIQGCSVWHWKDELSPAEGWIVIDSPVPTHSGGGLFLHEDATLNEVRDIARSMSAKLAVSSQPQVVGAKGGIRFPHEDSRAPLVLERFIRDNAAVLSEYWGTGGDLNTDHDIIDRHARAYCSPGTLTALDALSRSLGYCGSNPKEIHDLLGEQLDNSGWGLSEFCVGYVMAVTLKELITHTKPELMGQARLVLQGFGCVGSTFAQAAAQLGIGRVVAISSQYGFLVNDNGIDCASIEAYRRASEKNPVSGLDPRSLEAGLTKAELQSALYAKRRVGSTDEEHLVDFLAASQGEVFVPCAQRYILTPKALSTLSDKTFAEVPHGARFILAGANNIFNPVESRDETLSKLDSASIRMLPEWISNSGTSNLFMRACSGLALKGYALSNLEASANDTKAFINTAFGSVGYRASNIALWEACEDLATTRRRTGAVNLLGVKRMAHLTLTSHVVERAAQTVKEVYNAKFNKDESLYRLPGLGDPTLSIVKAPESAGPGDIGLSVRFSVYNIAKARQVLEAQRITFKDRRLRDGSTELVLLREETGYRMSLCQAPAEEPANEDFSTSPNVLTSIAGSTRQLDHYAAIMPDTKRMKVFHERMLGFTPLHTFTVNTGSAADGSDDGLMQVMGIPCDSKRVVILTEGLNPDSVFYKLMMRHDGAYLHHVALEVEDVDAVFAEVRAKGWNTTAEDLSYDVATGLRQFFLKEEETGCILELIGRSAKDSKPENQEKSFSDSADDENVVKGSEVEDVGTYANGQVAFRTENIVALARSLDQSD
ncbi:hypothetical protein BDP67DRAFT_616616 [Colletotrichum lupini]|nr:hypothetical protein BDP67DRAFT_616616 [Colletotrichum lupini]